MDTTEKISDINISQENLDHDLLYAVQHGKTADVVALISQGANINATSGYFKNTPLILAAEGGHIDIINILISTPGIQVNQKNKDLYTALMSAAAFGRTAAIKVLLTVNGILVNLQNEYGKTALILAVKSKKTDTVSALLDAPDIDITITSKQGRTALDEAIYNPSTASSSDRIYGGETLLLRTQGDPISRTSFPTIQINQEIVALLKYHETLLRSPLRSPTEPAPQEATGTLDTGLAEPVKSVIFSLDGERMKQPRSENMLENEAEIAVQPKKICVKMT
jgi:ankyrin repeat protein